MPEISRSIVQSKKNMVTASRGNPYVDAAGRALCARRPLVLDATRPPGDGQPTVSVPPSGEPEVAASLPVVDLRSDTVTRPTAAMREAIARAVVGDDVFDDDPTVHALQDRVAALLGKERALFVPSGTMGNQLAVKSLTFPGDEVLLERDSHIFNYEAAGGAALSGVQLRPLAGVRGALDPAEVIASVRPDDVHAPVSRLVCLENTHQRSGGSVIGLEPLTRTANAARERGMAVHLDGARLWNAIVATGVAAARWA